MRAPGDLIQNSFEPMLLGYNTNGLAHHDPCDAIKLLADIGYRSVALSIDHHLLNPYSADFRRQLPEIRSLLERYGLRSVVETGARFLLDPHVKHEPTLVSADPAARSRRVVFLKHAVDIARELSSDCVSLWSGIARDDIARDGAAEERLFDRLADGLSHVLEHAAAHGSAREMPLGFEPEPGMFIDTMARYRQLVERVPGAHLRLTLDVGHLHCLGETPIAERIVEWGPRLANVHIEDMRRGVHEHLMFGEGEIDFSPVMAALRNAGYAGGVHVELSRHSHAGPQAARQAFEFLQPLAGC